MQGIPTTRRMMIGWWVRVISCLRFLSATNDRKGPKAVIRDQPGDWPLSSVKAVIQPCKSWPTVSALLRSTEGDSIVLELRDAKRARTVVRIAANVVVLRN